MLKRPCEGCGKMTELRIRKIHRFLFIAIPGKWHSSCPECAPAVLELKFDK